METSLASCCLSCFCGPCFTEVPEKNVALVERFGKFQEEHGPGALFLNPITSSVAATLNLKIQQLNVIVETKSKDNVFVNLTIAVQFKVNDKQTYNAYYKLASPQESISAYVKNAVRAVTPNLTLDELFLEKERIATNVGVELESFLGDSGYIVMESLVTDIDPDRTVKAAMNQMNTEKRLREAELLKAEARKITEIKAAEAEAEAKYLSGVGLAEQRKAIIDGLYDSVQEFQNNVRGSKTSDVMELIMMNQHFDTLKELSGQSKNNTLFLSHGPGALKKYAQELQQKFMITSGDKWK